jgi:tRNA A-37 threonylcarbamoyl transferase component Bud32
MSLRRPLMAAVVTRKNAEQEAAVLEGLDRLHKAGVLHGDPSPANVLLPDASSTSGQPVWIDFERASTLTSPYDAEAELHECRSWLEARRRRHA